MIKFIKKPLNALVWHEKSFNVVTCPLCNGEKLLDLKGMVKEKNPTRKSNTDNPLIKRKHKKREQEQTRS